VPVLALDIGGTKLAAGVVDEDARVRSFVVQPSHAERGAEAVLGDLFALGRRAVVEARADLSEVDAVGIGCGGPLDAARGVLLAPLHLPGWRDVPVAALAEEAYGRPAVLENDATAAAAAEHRHGAGAGRRSMVYLTLSTGVGGGVVVEGRLHRGAFGNGAELGHVTVDWRGRRCAGCGRPGCLEAYVSGTSIAERALEGLDPESSLARIAAPTAADVHAAAAAGDAYAQAVWDETIEALACGLTSIVNLLEPELVVLGGGVTRAGDRLFRPLRRAMRELAGPLGPLTEVVPAALGDRVGVVGAAVIAAAAADRAGPSHSAVREHADLLSRVQTLVPQVDAAADRVIEALARGGRLIAFGNGGSAADAQHLAGELVGRFKRERRPLPAQALTVDPSVVTCIVNDYDPDELFARQVEALASGRDVVVGFTTSGRSENVVRGLAAARRRGATTLLFSGGDGRPASEHATVALVVPSTSTARVQELHVLLMHQLVERIDAWAAGELEEAG
jgi:glucokinase